MSSSDFDRGVAQGAAGRQGEVDRLTRAEAAEALVASLTQERDKLRQEIAEAREACPVVRQDRFADAPLLTLVKEQVSLLFRLQSRADAAYIQQDRTEETVEEKSNDKS